MESVTPTAAPLADELTAELRVEAWRHYLAASTAYQALAAERGMGDPEAREAWRVMMRWHHESGCCS